MHYCLIAKLGLEISCSRNLERNHRDDQDRTLGFHIVRQQENHPATGSLLWASFAGETLSSRPSASRVSPHRIRRTTSLLRTLHQPTLSTRMTPVALVGLRIPCATGAVVQRKARFLHVRRCLQISQSGVTINRALDQFVKLPFDFAFMWCMLSLVLCRSGSGSYLECVQ